MSAREYDPFWDAMNGRLSKSTIVLDTVMWLTWAGFEDDFASVESVARVMGPEVSLFKTMKNGLSAKWDKLTTARIVAPVVGVSIGAYLLSRLVSKRKELFKAFCMNSGAVKSLPEILAEMSAKLHASKTPAQLTIDRIDSVAVIISAFWNSFWALLTYPYTKLTGGNMEKPTMMGSILIHAMGPLWEEKFKDTVGFPAVLFIAMVETAAVVPYLIPAPNAPCAVTAKKQMVISFFMIKILLHYFINKLPYNATWHALWNLAVNIKTENRDGTIGSSIALVASLGLNSGVPPKRTIDGFKQDHKDQVSHQEEYIQDNLQVQRRDVFLPATQNAPYYEDCPIAQHAVLEEEPKEGMYVLLSTTACFFRPHGPLQFWHAYKQRNCDEVPMTFVCEQVAVPPLPHQTGEWKKCLFKPYGKTDCPIGRRWKKASLLMIRVLETASYDSPIPLVSAEWARKFNGAAKKQRARDALIQRNDGDIYVRSGIFLKGDEVLFGREGALKGRTVKSLDPTMQAFTYKAIDAVISNLKNIFDGKWAFPLRDWLVTFAIGSGKTGDALDKWHRQSLDWVSYGEKRIACIFAGDDFFALVHEKDCVVAFENDFSKFDRTQGVHALGAELRILVFLGMEYRQAKLLFETQLAKPRYQSDKYQIKQRMEMEAQRATGSSDTTVGNTLTNMMSVLFALHAENGVTNLVERQLDLGFVSKLQIHRDIIQGTFLKGWWLPLTTEGLQWLPLPSQVIKIGKILTNPETIFPELSSDQAWRAAATSMAASYGTISFNYPLFGTFLKRYVELSGKVVDLQQTRLLTGLAFRTRRETCDPPDRQHAIDYFTQRYGLSEDDILEMETEICSAPFPGLLTHVGWAVIARRDYG